METLQQPTPSKGAQYFGHQNKIKIQGRKVPKGGLKKWNSALFKLVEARTPKPSNSDNFNRGIHVWMMDANTQ
jgi:hypothetical protein